MVCYSSLCSSMKPHTDFCLPLSMNCLSLMLEQSNITQLHVLSEPDARTVSFHLFQRAFRARCSHSTTSLNSISCLSEPDSRTIPPQPALYLTLTGERRIYCSSTARYNDIIMQQTSRKQPGRQATEQVTAKNVSSQASITRTQPRARHRTAPPLQDELRLCKTRYD